MSNAGIQRLSTRNEALAKLAECPACEAEEGEMCEAVHSDGGELSRPHYSRVVAALRVAADECNHIRQGVCVAREKLGAGLRDDTFTILNRIGKGLDWRTGGERRGPEGETAAHAPERAVVGEVANGH